MIKFTKGDDTPEQRRRLVHASGGEIVEGKNKHKYAVSTLSQTPLTKNSQFAGSGANVIWTQPMFFSPLHTPQNWQIASKRREIYQWSFVSPCGITLYDGSIMPISVIYEESQPISTSSLLIADDRIRIDLPNIKVQDGHGNLVKPDRASKKWAKKKINKIKVLGGAESLVVTNDHNCMVIKKEDVVCKKNKWNAKKCICNYNAPTCKRAKCQEYINKEYNISTLKAKDIEKGDYLLVSFTTEVIKSIITSEEEARYAGHLASDGWVCNGNNKTNYFVSGICFSKKEKDYVLPTIKKVFSQYDINIEEKKSINSNCVTLTENSDQLYSIRSSNPSLYDFSVKTVVGKGKNKRFTDQVTLLNPKLQLHVLGAYIQSDGTFNKANKCVEITTYSPNLANQLVLMCYRCGILARVNKQPISSSKTTFSTDNSYRYIVNISSSECEKIAQYVPGKVLGQETKKARHNKRFFWKNFVVTPVISNISEDYEGYVYDVRVPGTYTVTANGIACHQSRFYYENEPKIAAGIDFYCFTPQMQVLMENGTQKAISSIKEGDTVRCHDGSVGVVSKVHTRNAKEDIYNIKIHGIKNILRVTAGHEIFVQRNNKNIWQQIYQLKKTDSLLTPIDNVRNSYIARKIKNIKIEKYEGPVFDLTIEGSHTYVVNRVSVHNSGFPMNGFKFECKDRKILNFYDRLAERIRLNHWLKLLSFEYYLLGDVFPFVEYECSRCGGGGYTKNNEICYHPGGTIKRITVMNPDWITVHDNPMTKEAVYFLEPDDELKGIIANKEPREVYDRLPPLLIQAVMSGQPIQLSNRCMSHMKHNASPYGTYGNSIVRRMFTYLAYKTKLMTANWIVAERLILPIRVVKVGEKDRPASQEDLSDISNQLAAVANDPNLTLITHHAFCHDNKTEVLTDEGWKKHDELNHNEKIMVFDPNTENCRYEKPIKYHEFDYDGEMVKISGNKYDMMITPNHRMLRYKRNKKQWYVETAEKFASRNESDRYIRSFADYKAKDLEEINVCGYKVPIDDMLEFLGWYLSEGHSEYKPLKRRYIVSVSQSPTHNPQYCEEIDNCFSKIDIPFHKYEYEGRSTTWNILKKDIAKQIGEWFGHTAFDKKIPSFIKNLPPHRLRILINSYCKGDASWYHCESSEYVQCGTVSNQLADDLLEIMFKAGFSPTISRFGKENQYVVNCNLSSVGKGRFSRVKDNHISKKHYKGKVWCFTTSTGFFVTRREGRIAIQGNSYDWVGATGKIHSITNELEQIGKELLDGFMLNQALLNGEMGCHDEQTLTLTDKGFKKYDQISVEDKIACYNPTTKKLEYHLYAQKHVYDYDGDMIQFKDKNIDICVTPNHRMYVKEKESGHFEFTTADKIKKKGKIINFNEFWDKKYKNRYQRITSIQHVPYKGKVYCFSVPHGLFVTKRKDKITIQGNSYGGAQVGVEVMIRRLDSWRSSLSEWVEKNILLPVAMMQNFIDIEKSEEAGETLYLYPRIKWNDLNLRDKTNYRQTLIQLYDHGIVSTQTLLEEFDLDYDQETRRRREEQIITSAAGMVMPGGGGMPGAMPGGGMPMDMGMGGMGGMPGGDMGMGGMGGMPGGDMSGGMGGMPGGEMGGGMAAGATPDIKVGKRGSGGKSLEEQMPKAPMPKTVRLTSLEQKMFKLLQGMSNNVPYKLFGQYAVQMPGAQQPFLIDFAYPSVGVGVEADGDKWHSDLESRAKDSKRDQKLASVGWRILRFNEKAFDRVADMQKIIYDNLAEATKERQSRMKTASTNEEMLKQTTRLLTFEGINEKDLKVKRIPLPNDLGDVFLIGN